MTKAAMHPAAFSDFDIRISFVIRHLSFVIYQPYFASQ